MNLAVGFFDGVHLGHRKILAEADCALTFRNHPLSVLAPAFAPALLMTAEERLAAVADALGGKGAAAERVTALDFTPACAASSPEAFARFLSERYPRLTTVCCGANWTFGAGARGTPDTLRRLGFAVRIVPYAEWREAGAAAAGGVPTPVSSTRIRAALAAGRIPLAQAMLGRPYAVRGVVRKGKGEGRRLGFPTLNVRPFNPDLNRLLPFGVYAGTLVRESARPLPALANWGLAPTFGAAAWREPVLEIHLLVPIEAPSLPPAAGEEPLALTFRLADFLRPERRFADTAELKGQIAEDVRQARMRLAADAGAFRAGAQTPREKVVL